jgi:hypothetical protein
MVDCLVDKRNRAWRLVMKMLAPLLSTPAILISILMTGCMVGPNYHRPVVQTPGVYRDLSANPQAQAASFADLPWWQVFQDPQLQELIRTALKENYDLQLATERMGTCCSRRFRKRRARAVQRGYRQQAPRRANNLQPGRQRFPEAADRVRPFGRSVL